MKPKQLGFGLIAFLLLLLLLLLIVGLGIVSYFNFFTKQSKSDLTSSQVSETSQNHFPGQQIENTITNREIDDRTAFALVQPVAMKNNPAGELAAIMPMEFSLLSLDSPRYTSLKTTGKSDYWTVYFTNQAGTWDVYQIKQGKVSGPSQGRLYQFEGRHDIDTNWKISAKEAVNLALENGAKNYESYFKNVTIYLVPTGYHLATKFFGDGRSIWVITFQMKDDVKDLNVIRQILKNFMFEIDAQTGEVRTS